MSFFRSLLLLSLVCLFASLGLFALGSASGYGGFRGGYAVIEADVSVDDRLLRERLYAGVDNFAGSPVSESSQWVLLYSFGSMDVIPLDKFNARVYPLDPRNDGYAEKLMNVFVRDGKRFVYIPLKAGSWAPAMLNRQFSDLLGDIPFSAEYFGVGKPLSLFFITYAAASLSLLIISYFKKNYHSGMASLIAPVFVLSSLAFFGVPGIVLAALLLGLYIMLREPVNELIKMPVLKKGRQRLSLIYKDVIEPYKIYWVFLLVFMAAIGIVAVISQLPFLFLLLVSAASCAVFFLSVKTVLLWGSRHRRFNPVMIIRRRTLDFSFFLFMIPFAAAAFLAILLNPYVSGAYSSGSKFDYIIEEQDYFAHLSFQASFSRQRFGGHSGTFPAYFFDEDGLPSAAAAAVSAPAVNLDEFPPFPLKHLMDFFTGVNAGARSSPSPGTGKGRGISEILTLLILLSFLISGLLLRRKISFSLGVPEKSRWTDKNRKKTLLYNSKNTPRLQRGTSFFRLGVGSERTHNI